MLDREIRERFKEFQKRTGKYRDLEIDNVRFEEKKLEKLINIYDNQRIALSGNERNKKQGKYPYYGASGIIDYIDEYIFNGTYLIISEDGENLRSRKTSIAFFASGKFWVNNHVHIILGKEKKLLNTYIKHFIDSNKLLNYISFSSQPKLTQTNLKKILIPIPKPLNQKYTSFKLQEAIVEFLEDGFDRIKRIRADIDKQYDLFKRLDTALIPSTFIKDYVKFAFCRYAKEHNIGFNITDVEFEIKELNKISKIVMGQSPKGDFLNTDKIGKPFFQGKTNFGKVFLDKPTRWTTHSKREAKKNDILISLRAPAGVVNISTMDISIGRGLASIQVFKEIENFYILYFLKNNETKISMENDRGGFFTSMSKDYLYNLKIPIPKDLKNYTSLEIQKIIANFIEFKSNEIQKKFNKLDEGYRNLERLHRVYLARTFTLIDWGAK